MFSYIRQSWIPQVETFTKSNMATNTGNEIQIDLSLYHLVDETAAPMIYEFDNTRRPAWLLYGVSQINNRDYRHVDKVTVKSKELCCWYVHKRRKTFSYRIPANSRHFVFSTFFTFHIATVAPDMLAILLKPEDVEPFSGSSPVPKHVLRISSPVKYLLSHRFRCRTLINFVLKQWILLFDFPTPTNDIMNRSINRDSQSYTF